MTVAHVPETIYNDLPLPGDIVSFGFTTACNLGKDLVRNLMLDAVTTERWFLVTVMGRHAGHLALGIGGAAGATCTLIAEEMPEEMLRLDRVADILEGAIIKRCAQGKDHGVVLVSDGLGEKLDPESLGEVERDGYGNVRLSELDLGRLLKNRVAESLQKRNLSVTIVAKLLGYELRCAPPGPLTSSTAVAWATRAPAFSWSGGRNAMVTIQAGRLVPIPFDEMMDPQTGKIRVRMVDLDSETYKMF
jgi:6-phosphofructokinase